MQIWETMGKEGWDRAGDRRLKAGFEIWREPGKTGSDDQAGLNVGGSQSLAAKNKSQIAMNSVWQMHDSYEHLATITCSMNHCPWLQL